MRVFNKLTGCRRKGTEVIIANVLLHSEVVPNLPQICRMVPSCAIVLQYLTTIDMVLAEFIGLDVLFPHSQFHGD